MQFPADVDDLPVRLPHEKWLRATEECQVRKHIENERRVREEKINVYFVARRNHLNSIYWAALSSRHPPILMDQSQWLRVAYQSSVKHNLNGTHCGNESACCLLLIAYSMLHVHCVGGSFGFSTYLLLGAESVQLSRSPSNYL